MRRGYLFGCCHGVCEQINTIFAEFSQSSIIVKAKKIMRKQLPAPLQVRFGLLALIVLMVAGGLSAQDIHYSQYWNAPFNTNPALTGVFRGDTRFTANYRSQWNTVPVEYMTFTGAIDHKFPVRGERNGFFAGGFNFNYDQAGLSRLHLATFGLNGSYTHKLSQGVFATAGASASFNQRGFKIQDLTFDNQYSDPRGQYDPGLPTGENFPNFNRIFADFGTGLNLRIQSVDAYGSLVDELAKRSRLDIGVGLFHFNRPDQSFIKDMKAPLSMRLSPYMFGVLMLGQDLDLVGNFSAQFQGTYKEMVGMAGIKYHFDTQPGKQAAVQLGVGYRFHEISDAIIPGIELTYDRWMAGFTYDINISPFNVATNRRGGPEFSLRYIITKVPVLSTFKVCPLI